MDLKNILVRPVIPDRPVIAPNIGVLLRLRCRGAQRAADQGDQLCATDRKRRHFLRFPSPLKPHAPALDIVLRPIIVGLGGDVVLERGQRCYTLSDLLGCLEGAPCGKIAA